ncbi:MAG: TonB-dependent receptor [Caulobacteraceae bacterium]|nr:TonB-dependent receptor [Caulobacteraceae bacterium]
MGCKLTWLGMAARGLALTGLAALLVVPSAPARAQSAVFNIPAGDAAASLAAWSARSGIQIKAADGFLTGLPTQAAKGEMAPRDALNLMLKGSGVVMVADEGSAITLAPAARSGDLPGLISLGYDQALRTLLAPVFRPEVTLRMTAAPRPGGEYAVGLALEAGRYSIVSSRAPAQIWNEAITPDPTAFQARLCTVRLDAALGRALEQDWKQVVGSLPAGGAAVGPEDYDFAYRDGVRIERRQTPSPAIHAAERNLVEVGEAMIAYCDAPTVAAQAELEAAVGALAT